MNKKKGMTGVILELVAALEHSANANGKISFEPELARLDYMYANYQEQEDMLDAGCCVLGSSLPVEDIADFLDARAAGRVGVWQTQALQGDTASRGSRVSMKFGSRSRTTARWWASGWRSASRRR